MALADGSLTQADTNYSINYLAQADWSMSVLYPMSLLLTHLNGWTMYLTSWHEHQVEIQICFLPSNRELLYTHEETIILEKID